MANQQHIQWLLEGVEAWNARRAEKDFQPGFREADIRQAFTDAGKLDGIGRFDLREADLRAADLRGADLEEADLEGAFLVGAELRGAYFEKANLVRADLAGADLEGAFLRRANVGEANLRRADLRWADLGAANLRGADLGGAKLEGAHLEGAIVTTNVFSASAINDARDAKYTDLSKSLNLTQEQVDHMIGDSGTILPDHITRPAHWPEIEELVVQPEPEPETAATPQSVFVFISYARSDADKVSALREMLRSHYIPTWWDQDIGPGESWREKIAAQLDTATAVVTFWTDTSTQSNAVIEEAARAQQMGKLVHARLDSSALPYGFGETQYANLQDWDGTWDHPELLRLVQAIQDKLAPPDGEALKQRLFEASPVAFVARNKKLSPIDTPPNTDPAIQNDLDKQQRMIGLTQSVENLRSLIEDRDTYQLPNDLHNQVIALLTTLREDGLTWYALIDDCDALSECMARHDAKRTWNDGIVSRLTRIIQRIGELQPLMQPLQIPPGETGAKPPETDPHVTEDRISDARGIANDLEEVLETEEAIATLDDAARDLISSNVDTIAEAAEDVFAGEGRFPRLRRAVKNLAYIVGGITAAVTGGVFVNLLTAPEAALTLAARLEPILDRIIALFI